MMFVRHLLLALAVSFGLSLAFWAIFGVFVLVPFLVVSTLCALAGLAIGWLAGRRLAVTVLAPASIRIGICPAMSAGGWVVYDGHLRF